MNTNIKLRKLEINDLESYLHLNNPEREFYKYNGPYYGKPTLEKLKKDVDNKYYDSVSYGVLREEWNQ